MNRRKPHEQKKDGADKFIPIDQEENDSQLRRQSLLKGAIFLSAFTVSTLWFGGFLSRSPSPSQAGPHLVGQIDKTPPNSEELLKESKREPASKTKMKD